MLYIIRHGKTDWNDLDKLQGRTDIPLNDKGRAMAYKTAAEYKAVHFDVCYSSPLVRALETAQILLENRDVPIITDDRLKEMCFGIYEGSTDYFHDVNNPINLLFRAPEEYKVPFEGAESFEDLFERTGDFLENVVKPDLEAGKDVLIVGHGAMNNSIICQLKNIPLKDFWKESIENCKLKVLGDRI